MGRSTNESVSRPLKKTDDGKNNKDREPYHVPIPHLVAVANRKVPDTAGADCPGNRRNADKTDECEHRHARAYGDSFFQIHPENNLTR